MDPPATDLELQAWNLGDDVDQIFQTLGFFPCSNRHDITTTGGRQRASVAVAKEDEMNLAGVIDQATQIIEMRPPREEHNRCTTHEPSIDQGRQPGSDERQNTNQATLVCRPEEIGNWIPEVEAKRHRL